MGLSYSHDPVSCVLRIVGEGPISIKDRIDFFAELQADKSLIVTVSDITTTPTIQDVGAIAGFAGQLLARFSGKLAIVNSRAGHVTISHIVGMRADDGSDRVRVYMSDEAALTWIKS